MLVAGVALSAPATAAAWSPPATMNAGGTVGHQVAVAQGSSGVEAIAWSNRIDQAHSTLEVRVRQPFGEWGPEQTISPASDQQNWTPSVAVDGAGDVLVVWDAEEAQSPYLEGVSSAFAPAGRPFGAATPIAWDHDGTGIVAPEVSFDAAGNAYAIWHQQDGRLHASARPAGGAFGTPQTLPPGGAPDARTGDYAIGPNGDAIAAWTGAGTTWVATRAPGGDFGAPQSLGVAARGVAVAIGADGTAAVSMETTADSGADPRLYVATRSARAASFGAADDVAPTFIAYPSVSPRGDVTLIGMGGPVDPYRADGLWALTKPAGAGWGPVERLAPGEEGTDDPPAIAAGPDGALHVAWLHYDDTASDHTIARILTSARPAGGAFGADQTLAEIHGVAGPPVIAAATGSGVLAAWEWGPFGMGTVQASEDEPMAQPAPTATPGPPAAPEPQSLGANDAPRTATKVEKCTVPSLRGRTLAKARRLLGAHHCTLGRVTKASHRRRSRVTRQWPRAHVRTTHRVTVRLG